MNVEEVDFSQRGEQAVILRLLDGRSGRFLDIGANDGRTFSNTYALALRGWSGLCIEPSPRAFVALREIYREKMDIACMHAAVTDRSEEPVKLWDFVDSLVSTCVAAERDKWEFVAGKPTEIDVPSVDVKWICDHYAGTFEMVSIDAEGWSWPILERCPLEAWMTKLVVVEYGDRLAEIVDMIVQRQGFVLHMMTPENLVFAR